MTQASYALSDLADVLRRVNPETPLTVGDLLAAVEAAQANVERREYEDYMGEDL